MLGHLEKDELGKMLMKATENRIVEIAQNMQQKDPINPDHYGGKDNPYEAIKVIRAWGLGFCLGNTVKYIARAGKKGDIIEDLEKAKRYIEMEIENLKSK